MTLSSWVPTSDKRLDPIFTEYLSEVGATSGALPTNDKGGCRFVGTLSEVGATSDKYSRKQGVKPLSEVQVGGREHDIKSR